MENYIDERWEYNSHQYVDFVNDDLDLSSDEWFEIDHEKDPIVKRDEYKEEPKQFKSPLKELDNNKICAKQNMRRSVVSHSHPKANQENARRILNLKTRSSAGRQTELKRKSLTKPTNLSNARHRFPSMSSVSSKTSQSSKHNDVSSETKENNFIESLRKYDSPDPESKFRVKVTVPVPFKFARESTKKTMVEEFRSIAQQVIAYQNKTPQRFRMKPRRASAGEENPQPKLELGGSMKKSYVRRSPNLQTKTRTRNVSIQSQRDLEEKEYEEIKNYRFHANPINMEIFSKNYVGVPEKRVKNTTVVKPFSFHTNVPLKPTLMPTNNRTSFRARPVPAEILKKPVGIPNVPKKGTVPLKPFSFEEFDKERLLKKQHKINEYYEEEKRLREFRANPLPNLGVKGVPEKQPKLNTKLEPFPFISNSKELHALEKKRFAEELERVYQRPVFKAKPLPTAAPFIPQKPNRFLTCVDAPLLNTDQRAIERKEYNQHLAERERERQEQEERIAKMKLQEEEAKVTELRASAVHKAQPIRNYKQVEKVPSKDLTEPITPFKSRNILGSLFTP